MIKNRLKKVGFVILTICFAGGLCSPAFSGEWEKPWSSVKGAAAQRCVKTFEDFQLQAVCMENEIEGYNKMQGDFGMPSAVARKAKDRCERTFEDFQLQAVCMENEKNGYDKMKNYVIPVTRADDRCNYSSLPGKEFQFREGTESLHKYGYLDWKKEPETSVRKLDYQDYVGKKGKLQELEVKVHNGSSWYVAVLETCEKLYIRDAFRKGLLILVQDIENHRGVYFLDTLRQVDYLIGKKIWVNQNYVKKDIVLFTDDPNINYPLAHLEALEIVGSSTKRIGHSHGAGPFNLVVKKETGEKGYMVYNKNYFFLEKPN